MYQTIMMSEFEQLYNSETIDLLDVREMDEFQEGHIAGAVNLPLSQFPEVIKGLSKQSNYYIICHSGGRSQRACDYLSAQGFHTTNVLGGMCVWQGAVIKTK